MTRIQSYTQDKIDDLLTAESTARTNAIASAIASEKTRADSAYLVSDYVVVRTTGTGADIQATLNAAETTGGGSVSVPKGVWLINSTLLMPSNITLLLSPGAIIRRNSSTVDCLIRNKTNGTVGGYTANQDMSIIGGEWDGNRAAFSTNVCMIAFGHCNNIVVEGAEFYGCVGWHCLEFNAVQIGVARFNTFTDYPNGSEFIQIDAAFSSGTWPWNGPYDDTCCDDILIQGNTFTGGGRGVGTHASKIGKFHKNIRIVDNHFGSMSSWAIEMQDWTQVIIDDNNFDTCYIGVYFVSAVGQVCDGFTISNNIFRNCTGRATFLDGTNNTGRYIRNVVFSGNIVDGSASYGLNTDYGKNISYIGNTITGCVSNGLWVYRSIEVTITGNQILGNNTGGDSIASDLKIGDAGQETVGTVSDVVVSANIIGDCLVRSGVRILIIGNHVRSSMTTSGSAPLPNQINRVANFIANTYEAAASPA